MDYKSTSIKSIDINCDMGEGIGNDAAIMPFISSANIACGYHAGNKKIMTETMQLAIQNKVAIGAHPSFFDIENFGRKEMQLSSKEVYDLVLKQLQIADAVANSLGTKLHHVKPHGALYNMSARKMDYAQAIATAVKDFNEELILYGLSGSFSVSEAKAIGLKTANEVFADRTYQDDGSLTPRLQPNAMIEDAKKASQQVLQMIRGEKVTTLSGNKIPIITDTICIHGDGMYAVEFAKKIYKELKNEEIKIEPIQSP